MKRTLLIIIALIAFLSPLSSRDRKVKTDTLGGVVLTDAYLDSVEVKKRTVINDYTLIGVQYGVGLNQVIFNPAMKSKMQFVPYNAGITWTRYCKMFGYMPFFGIQAGLFYAREGYKLDDKNEVQGANEAFFNVLEVPVMAHCHVDFWKMKLLINLGLYGSYRMSVERVGKYVPEGIRNDFLGTDRRWDYGIRGGLGFGFVFDPVEIHFNAIYKYGLGSLYDPNYNSDYYYRFASVSNFVFSVGLHFQLTKRTGKTNHEIKKEAREIVRQNKMNPEN